MLSLIYGSIVGITCGYLTITGDLSPLLGLCGVAIGTFHILDPVLCGFPTPRYSIWHNERMQGIRCMLLAAITVTTSTLFLLIDTGECGMRLSCASVLLAFGFLFYLLFQKRIPTGFLYTGEIDFDTAKWWTEAINRILKLSAVSNAIVIIVWILGLGRDYTLFEVPSWMRELIPEAFTTRAVVCLPFFSLSLLGIYSLSERFNLINLLIRTNSKTSPK
jgi:hypothetical protein